MFTYKKLANYVDAEPFRPFRIQMKGGRVFDIRHPEMVQVGRTTMLIHTYWSDDPELEKQRQVEISLLLIESIEPLESVTRSQGA